ncbi:uncharacterized [Tachysurus ichikawai]
MINSEVKTSLLDKDKNKGIIEFHLMRKEEEGVGGVYGAPERGEQNGVAGIEKETRGEARTKGQGQSVEEVTNVPDGMKGRLKG